MSAAAQQPQQQQQVLSGGMREQIRSLLGGGTPAGQVAAAVGCDPSYISQLMAEEGFSQAVLAQNILRLQAQTKRDANYDEIEDRLIQKLSDALPMMVNPDKILRAITVVNGAKRRGAAQDAPMTQITNVIQLNLPTQIINRYQTNGNNEVIEVNGQGMTSMPAAALVAKLKAAGGAASATEAQIIPAPARAPNLQLSSPNTDVQLPVSPPHQGVSPDEAQRKWQLRAEAEASLEQLRRAASKRQPIKCEQF